MAQLQAAAAHLRQGRPAEAVPLLRAAAARWPQSPDAQRLLGLALRDSGDFAGAEGPLRTALALDPRSGPSAVALSELLLASARAPEAELCMAPLAAAPGADINVLTALANAIKAQGRLDEARALYARIVAESPNSAVAEHNLASMDGDLERFADAEAGARRALAKGLDAPETWLVLGRALLGQDRHGESEAALREAIRRRPDYVDAHGELAQLIWMTTEDAQAAVASLDAALRLRPDFAPLALKKAEILDYAGDPDAAIAALTPIVADPASDPVLHVMAARLLGAREPERALEHAHIAAKALPLDYIAQSGLCEAYLAAGDGAAAAALAEGLRARMPENQHALALLATAWRLTGDARYDLLYDYDALVAPSQIAVPPGWTRLEDFLADLTQSLTRLHTRRTHPIGQSVRHGSQTSQSLDLSDDPVIKAFFVAIDGPIRERLAALGRGSDAVRSRNTGDYGFNGVWSVRLRPDGFHANHVHPKGWLSSACYIALPDAVERGQEGWIKFGEPGVPTLPGLPFQHAVKPEPGRLVLFPSYMWHGTIPFSGDQPRLTIAFDVIPA
jgi:Flp pilus assembly protein TadD